MLADAPTVTLIAGPNGAGKSTCASLLLPESVVFINADEIAKTLPGYPSPGVDVQAGRLLITRMEELAGQRRNFAVETTLSSRSFAPRIRQMQHEGYRFSLLFIWLPDATLSIARVAERVRQGGHFIPEPTIRRRYASGLKNFFSIYQPMADTWGVYENIRAEGPTLLAEGNTEGYFRIVLPSLWEKIIEDTGYE